MGKNKPSVRSWRGAIAAAINWDGATPTPELEVAHATINRSVVSSLHRTCCWLCGRLTGRVECHACNVMYKGSKKSWGNPALDAGRLCPTCTRGLLAYMGIGTFYPARTRRAMFKVQTKLASMATAKHNTVEGQREYVAKTLKARAEYRAIQRQSGRRQVK